MLAKPSRVPGFSARSIVSIVLGTDFLVPTLQMNEVHKKSPLGHALQMQASSCLPTMQDIVNAVGITPPIGTAGQTLMTSVSLLHQNLAMWSEHATCMDGYCPNDYTV